MMGLKRFLSLNKLPQPLRRDVVQYYLFKLTGRKADNRMITAKNLLKLIAHQPELKVKESSDAELLLSLALEKEILFYCRTYPSSDIPTLKEVWGLNEYEPCIQILRDLKISNPLIVDIGSNAGYSLLYFASRMPHAQFICVEPDAGNFEQLSKNIRINQLKNVHTIRGAWYTKNCRLSIKNDYRGGTHASFYVAEDENGSIQGYTLDKLLPAGTEHIDLLKVDIEGTEHLLLEAENNARLMLKDVRTVAIEIHDDKANRKQIMQNFHNLGFTCFDKGTTTFAYRK